MYNINIESLNGDSNIDKCSVVQIILLHSLYCLIILYVLHINLWKPSYYFSEIWLV